VLAGWFAGFVANDWRPGGVATALAACVVLYDSVLKRTPLAPLLMGACRALNVLLGMSLGPLAAEVASPYVRWGTPAALLISTGVGIYVVGVTVFARTEARSSSRGRLIVGMAILLGGMALLAVVPYLTDYQPSLVVGVNGWYLLWAVLALITARRCALAIFEPSPPRVQAAVRHCVQSIIILDAAVIVGYVGPYWGLVVLALILPTLALAQWLNAT
jgi:4-hydroxybenzoate polyprenyltransferase